MPALPWRDTAVSQALAKYPGVRLAYGGNHAREATAEGENPGAVRLEKLLAKLLAELRDAATQPDDRRCRAVVESIEHVDAAPGARERRMLNTLQDQQLLADWDALVGSGSE